MKSTPTLFHFLLFVLPLFTVPADAEIIFRIADHVVQPGASTATVELIVDPGDDLIDGLQFGVEVDGGASVSWISTNSDWRNLISLGNGDALFSETISTEGAGMTYVADQDEDDVNRFQGVQFPVASIGISFAAPTTEGEIFTVSLTSSLGTPAVPAGYYLGSRLHTDPTIVSGVVRVADSARAFQASGVADVFDGDNWSPTGAPEPVDHLSIDNGATAQGVDGGALLQTEELYVGDSDGDGHLILQNVDLVTTRDQDIGSEDDSIAGTATYEGSLQMTGGERFEALYVRVGHARVESTAGVDATGSLSLNQVEDVLVRKDMEFAMFRGTELNAPATFNADVHIADASTFVVERDIFAGKLLGGDDPAAVLSATANLRFEDIGEMVVGDQIDLGTSSCAGSSQGTQNHQADAAFRDLGTLKIIGDLRIMKFRCRGETDLTGASDVTFERIDRMVIGEDLEIAELDHDGSGDVSVDVIVRFTEIDDLLFREELEMSVIGQDLDATATAVSTSRLEFTEVPMMRVLRRFEIGKIEQSTFSGFAPGATSEATAVLTDTTATVGIHTLVGVVGDDGPDAGSTPPTPDPGFAASGELILSRSSLITPVLWVGVVEAGLVGDPSGLLDLSGFVETDFFELGPGGTLALKIQGDLPATAATIGEDRHARVVATDTALSGTIRVDIEHLPPASGTTEYDLIITPPGGLDVGGATLEIGTVPQGYAVRSFEVVQTGASDLLRLTIDGPDLFSDDFESGDLSAWTAVVSN